MKRVFPPSLAAVERQFLPHPGGRGRAKLLHHRALSFYLLFFIAFLLTLTGLDRRFPGVLGFATDIQVDEIVRLTNEERVAHGLSSLKVNASLAEAARRKAEDMFADDYWAHVAPDGAEPWDFIDESGYVYVTAGENLAKDFNHSSSVIQAWLNSPSHRENLLSPKFEDIGIAVVDGELSGFDTTLVVQMFGKTQAAYRAEVSEAAAVSPEPVKGETTSAKETPVAPAPSGIGVPVNTEMASDGYRPLVSVQARAKGTLLQGVSEFDWRNVVFGGSLLFGFFLAVLLGLDILVLVKRRRLRVTARIVTHLLLLVLLLVGIWYSRFGAVL